MEYDFVTQWAIDTIREKYAEDIALVVSHSTLQNDDTQKRISYFVPATKRGEEFARTFILAGVGYDIWGIPWQRMEGFARLEEYNITVLADAEVLYARTEQDRERFAALQKELAANLADDGKMRICALEAYRQAREIYLNMLFSAGGDVKMGAGYVLDYLARAVAFTNHSYFHHSHTDQLNELTRMTNVPEGFAELYREILQEKEDAGQKEACYRLIWLVQQFLEKNAVGRAEQTPSEKNYQDLADWYGELSYTWLRLRHYAHQGDAVKLYMWGAYLQSELNDVCEDFGLEKIDLMKYYDGENLQLLAEHGDEAEQKIRAAIIKGGGIIHEYADEKEFLNEI
ncbi:MAG: hypothetical protein K2I21_14745 [Acetatifactor sp.]|nr:hypothetical protein [Acetatifactor sp.]